MFSSSPKQMEDHPEFRAIVNMGDLAIPLIIGELRLKPSILVLALAKITGEIPYSDAERGSVKAMTNAWLSWAVNNGY
jgi:hypothetical protein